MVEPHFKFMEYENGCTVSFCQDGLTEFVINVKEVVMAQQLCDNLNRALFQEKKYRCILICESQFDKAAIEIREFKSKEELNGFKDGFTCGAGKYGSGDACAWSIEDLEHLNPDEKWDALHIAAIKKYLGDCK